MRVVVSSASADEFVDVALGGNVVASRRLFGLGTCGDEQAPVMKIQYRFV